MLPFPFISVSSKGEFSHLCPEEIADRKFMFSEFEAWEEEAKRQVATANDVNAKTFLTDGNFDVIGSVIERWKPHPLFVFFDEEETMIALAVLGVDIVTDESESFFVIGAFAVNPKFYRKGLGRQCAERLINEHRRQSKSNFYGVNGIVLLSEFSAVPFWTKLGFTKFESDILVTDCEGVEKMKLTF